jgi:hypothetical protein
MNRTDGYKYNEVGRLLCIANPNKYTDTYGKWDDKLKTCVVKAARNEKYIEMTYEHNKNELAFIHNHPNNSGISGNDIINLFDTPSIYIVIAVANNGKISYAFKNSDIDYQKLAVKATYTIFKSEDPAIRAKTQYDIFDKIFNNPDKYGLVICDSERKNI